MRVALARVLLSQSTSERAIRETNQQAAFPWQQSMLASVRHCQ